MSWKVSEVVVRGVEEGGKSYIYSFGLSDGADL